MKWSSDDIKNSKVAHLNPVISRPGQTTPAPQHKMQALGRMKAGNMNKTEAAYSQLLETKKQTGEIVNYWFEPFNIRIGENCFYKCDFLVLRSDMHLELHEVKGHLTDDALVKMRAVAAMYPFRLLMIKLIKGNWVEREF